MSFNEITIFEWLLIIPIGIIMLGLLVILVKELRSALTSWRLDRILLYASKDSDEELIQLMELAEETISQSTLMKLNELEEMEREAEKVRALAKKLDKQLALPEVRKEVEREAKEKREKAQALSKKLQENAEELEERIHSISE